MTYSKARYVIRVIPRKTEEIPQPRKESRVKIRLSKSLIGSLDTS